MYYYDYSYATERAQNSFEARGLWGFSRLQGDDVSLLDAYWDPWFHLPSNWLSVSRSGLFFLLALNSADLIQQVAKMTTMRARLLVLRTNRQSVFSLFNSQLRGSRDESTSWGDQGEVFTTAQQGTNH
jgi:hypothetical protein